ncbi:hypothetical protein F4779DRAFT_618817 [Xylariaceae sp. FL0662B]|nr:hypothetical protein F4779DRAFT_618817 [Xylariaceae sp. FL0662B]
MRLCSFLPISLSICLLGLTNASVLPSTDAGSIQRRIVVESLKMAKFILCLEQIRDTRKLDHQDMHEFERWYAICQQQLGLTDHQVTLYKNERGGPLFPEPEDVLDANELAYHGLTAVVQLQ